MCTSSNKCVTSRTASLFHQSSNLNLIADNRLRGSKKGSTNWMVGISLNRYILFSRGYNNKTGKDQKDRVTIIKKKGGQDWIIRNRSKQSVSMRISMLFQFRRRTMVDLVCQEVLRKSEMVSRIWITDIIKERLRCSRRGIRNIDRRSQSLLMHQFLHNRTGTKAELRHWIWLWARTSLCMYTARRQFN